MKSLKLMQCAGLQAIPAKAAGILDQTGSIEVGKDADIVLWTGNPFSVYSRAETVLIDGAFAFDMNNPKFNQ